MSFYPDITSMRLSNSTVELFRSCQRKFEFRKLFKHPAYEDSIAAEVGKCLHTGYQNWLMYQDRDRAIMAMMLEYPVKLQVSDSDDRSIYAAYATLNSLFDSVNLQQYEIATLVIDGEMRPAIEVPFEFRISGIALDQAGLIPITYVGKIDAILFDRITQRYIVVDIKTTRRKLNDMTATYFFDEQALPYGMILEKLLGLEDQSFDVTYLSVFVDLMAPVATPYTFSKNKEYVEDWARGLMVDIQLMRTYFDIGWFRRDAGACQSWGKNCPYFDFCQVRDHGVIRKLMAEGESEENLIQVADHFGKPWVSMELELGV